MRSLLPVLCMLVCLACGSDAPTIPVPRAATLTDISLHNQEIRHYGGNFIYWSGRVLNKAPSGAHVLVWLELYSSATSTAPTSKTSEKVVEVGANYSTSFYYSDEIIIPQPQYWWAIKFRLA